MINGSPLAPFLHDSTWPDDVLARFRPAVYYRYVFVPGRDPVSILRELTATKEGSDEWDYLKGTCDKIVHQQVPHVNDEAITNLTTNLLVFANLLLIKEYGLKQTRNLVIEENVDQHASKSAAQKFIASIDGAYASIESALKPLKKKGSKKGIKFRHDPLDLRTAKAVSAIPSTHPLVELQDRSRRRTLTLRIHHGAMDACLYEFYSGDPTGWLRVGGSTSSDRFADDGMASTGPFAAPHG